MEQKRKNKDYYLSFDEQGDLIKEEKDNDSIKIMEDNNTNINIQNDFYDNLSKFVKKLPDKKLFNKILIYLITGILILLTINILGLAQSIQKNSYTELNNSILNITTEDLNKEDIFFLSDIISNSNSNIKQYYNSLNNIIILKNNTKNSDIRDIKNNIQKDIEELNNLDKDKSYKKFKEPISLLIKRFNILVDLCDKISDTNNNKQAQYYNNSAKKEIELKKSLMSIIKIYFDNLNIEYSIMKDGTFFYTK